MKHLHEILPSLGDIPDRDKFVLAYLLQGAYRDIRYNIATGAIIYNSDWATNYTVVNHRDFKDWWMAGRGSEQMLENWPNRSDLHKIMLV